MDTAETTSAGRRAKGMRLPAPADYLDRHKTMLQRHCGLVGMVWAHGVCVSTGLSAHLAEHIFGYQLSPDHKDGTRQTNRFAQYLRGDRMPKPGPSGIYHHDLVATVGRHEVAKCANEWLSEHPIWKITHPNLEPHMLDELVQDLKKRRIHMEHFWPLLVLRPALTKRIEKFIEADDFDAFVAWLAIIRSEQFRGEPKSCAQAGKALVALMPIAEKHPIFGYAAAPFLAYLKDLCPDCFK